MKNSNESSQEGKLTQFLQSEIGRYIKVVGVTITVVSVYFTLQMQLNRMEDSIRTIETNHLTHLQSAYEDIKVMIEKQTERSTKLMEALAEMQLELKRVSTIIDNRL